MKIDFNNSYINLPEEFYSLTKPSPVKNPQLIYFNHELAAQLGLNNVDDTQHNLVEGLDKNLDKSLADYLSGNKLFEGSEPLSMAYAGHQFGGFSAKLGDGRAILLGEVISPDGVRYDIQLKGSGPTPWSRGGDGRSALGPVLREYLVSEAMAKFGVPTTRALGAVTTGEEVARTSLVPGGILTRVATGFVRVGTFEYFAARQKTDAIQTIADYEIERHYPEAKLADNRYAAFFEAVLNRQTKLIAQWMSFGFIHGVMNTDNMSIVGETIDYGPCAFMDDFSHSRVYSSIDHNSRYAYSNQPKIGQWNLVRLAESLLPLFIKEDEKPEAAVEIAQDILNSYGDKYNTHWLVFMCQKLGISNYAESDVTLINDLLEIMQSNKADFTLTFYHLSLSENAQDIGKQLTDNQAFAHWKTKWQQRLSSETTSTDEQQALMQSVNPIYIPRNHLIEAAIRAAEDNNDFSVFEELHVVLENPFQYQEGKDNYMLPPKPEEVVHQTFCGT